MAFGAPVTAPLTGPTTEFPTTTIGTSSERTTTLTAKTSVTTNKNGETEIRVKVAPVYETADKLSDMPAIDNPLIPGGK